MDLQGLFRQLEIRRHPNLMVGIETGDDAAIYRMSDDTALVITADFITPLVDDPFLYGQIAAANSISDVYAMGGKPLTVLNLCMFPVKAGADVLAQVLRGGLDKTHESGAILVGGHTVRDEEMKYGLAVNGVVNPRHYTPNSGARGGDVFLLTKPVGSGVYVGANRKDLVSHEEMLPVARKMAELNRIASETMMEFDARGATDITGFGLGGHTLGMARASRIGIRLFHDRVPRFPRAIELLEAGITTGLSGANLRMLEGNLEFSGTFSAAERAFYGDPQTSGGLFFGIQKKDAEACLAKLRERGVTDAQIVGEAFAADQPHLQVVRN